MKARRAKAGTKRLRAAKRTRRQKVIEERGIRYEELPIEIKGVVDKIKKARAGRIRGAAFAGAGAAYDMASAPGSEKHIGVISAAIYGGIDYLASNTQIRKHMKTLERLIRDSNDPKISALRVKYPFFLVDVHGNIIFTTKQRILALFGRLRGRTIKGGLQRVFPSPEEIVKKQRKIIRKSGRKGSE